MFLKNCSSCIDLKKNKTWSAEDGADYLYVYRENYINLQMTVQEYY